MNPCEQLLHSPTAKQWEKVGVSQHHGINVPLFSLHSSRSCGIGEFPDLLPLITWCKEIGLDVIQLLPLNDTGMDTSPYGAISAFALNPIYLGLAYLPYLDQCPDLQSRLSALQQLNSTQRVDYHKVLDLKRQFLQGYYKAVFHLFSSTSEYTDFVKQWDWLQEYALFKVLKVQHNWQSWDQWNKELRYITPEIYIELHKKFESEVTYTIFIQYLCFKQMHEVKKFAETHGVFLKGDIPILISRESADVWLHRSLFHEQYSAGAPPDMYSEEGQNWGFPIYNWEAMEKQEYSWWKQRLKFATDLYHLYRIDHIVGFFRLWAIPFGEAGRHGHFIPEYPEKWVEHGEKIMRMMIKYSSLLPIGEDLGTVPPEVRVCLNMLGICGTKVIRWERKWNEDKRFIKFENYPAASMTTVSTHDSDTLQLWWENCPKEARDFAEFMGWTYTDALSKPHHQEILRQSHHTGSLFHINLLQEYLVLIPGMSWPNPDDERINLPGVISDRNWTYRFRPSIEEIVSSIPLREAMHDIVS